MFPFFSDLINYLFGTNIVFPIPMFGFMVAMAFIAANRFFVFEMKRKEEKGLLSSYEATEIIGKKATISELAGNAFFGFLLGYKVLGAFLSYEEMAADPQSFMLSTKGSLISGIVVAVILTYLKYRETEKQRLPEPKEVKVTVHPYQLVGNMTFIAAIGGIIGAKLFDMIEDIPRLLEDPIDVIFAGSGLSIYGGLIVGGLSVVYYARKKGLSIIHVVDACAPALILAYGIGRIGCQLSGDGDWGMPNDTPIPDAISFLPEWMWAFDYPNNVLGINLQEDFTRMGLVSLTGKAWPTPFYETVMSFIIFGILWALRKKINAHGVIFSLYLAFNGIERFFIEFIRINPRYSFLGFDLSQAQIIAIILFLFGIVGFFFFTNKSKKSSKQ